MLSLFVGVILFFINSHLSTGSGLHTFVVWNVGQGQWLTYKDLQGNCHHFDCGGERAPWTSVRHFCPRKNYLYLTHADQDHTSFSNPGKRKLYWGPPSSTPSWLEIWQPELKKPGHRLAPERNHSTVYKIHQQILITGDNPQRVERDFVQKTQKEHHRVQILILGHHGSKTSTSSELLAALPRMRMAVASARLARHGHPHPEPLAKLQKRRTPVLRTEHWGHIWFIL